jgi:hypothetical protein
MYAVATAALTHLGEGKDLTILDAWVVVGYDDADAEAIGLKNIRAKRASAHEYFAHVTEVPPAWLREVSAEQAERLDTTNHHWADDPAHWGGPTTE